MPRTDHRRPAISGRDMFNDIKRHKLRKHGMDHPDVRHGKCWRIDVRTGERVLISEQDRVSEKPDQREKSGY